jgi:hypothetical protein
MVIAYSYSTGAYSKFALIKLNTMKLFTTLSVITCVVIGLSACQKSEIRPNITSGLIFHAPLDGNAKEETTHANGVVHGATPTKGHKENNNGGMLFKASEQDYIDFGDDDAYSFTNNVFTICCWVKTSLGNGTQALLSKRSDTGPFEYSIDNHFDTTVYDFDNWIPDGSNTVYGVDPLNSNATLDPGRWRFLAYVADGNTLKVYVNGVQQGSADMHNNGMSFGNTAAPLRIGMGGAFGVNHYFTGSMDDLRIYNRALSKADITSLMTDINN